MPESGASARLLPAQVAQASKAQQIQPRKALRSVGAAAVTPIPLERNANATRQARWRERRNAAKASEVKAKPRNPLRIAVAIGCAAVATTLLILSLAHLSAGIVAITRCAPWEGLALAIGIDAGLIAAEAAQLVSKSADHRLRRWCHLVIVGTLLWSGLLNAIAFATGEGLQLAASVAFGSVIPAMIFALTRIAVGLASTRS